MSAEFWNQATWIARLVGVAACSLALAFALRRRRWVARPLRALALIAIAAALWVPSFYLRPPPAPQTRWLFEGVRYERRVSSSPPRVVHLVRIDLRQPGLRAMVTPAQPTSTDGDRWELPARTTSAFLAEFDLQLAINANFFFPQWSKGRIAYYPQTGQGVNAVGRAVSDGHTYGDGDRLMRTLWLYDGGARITGPDAGPDGCPLPPAPGSSCAPSRFAVSGYPLLIGGAPRPRLELNTGVNPRAAAAVDAAGHTLILLVADGRQPFYSDGASLIGVGRLLLSEGAHDAIELDGGGSASLVVRENERPRVLNVPVHGRFPPGAERPVANHLGFSGLRPPP